MPLQKGSSKKIISKNIGELISTYKEKGKIGNIKPKDMKHAKKIAAAISYKEAKKNSKKKKKALLDSFLESLNVNDENKYIVDLAKTSFSIIFENEFPEESSENIGNLELNDDNLTNIKQEEQFDNKTPENVTLLFDCLVNINKCLKYLQIKGEDFTPNRLESYLSKLYRLYSGLNNNETSKFNEFYDNYKDMIISDIIKNLETIKKSLLTYLPENMKNAQF